jgi:hypothetical protein
VYLVRQQNFIEVVYFNVIGVNTQIRPLSVALRGTIK